MGMTTIDLEHARAEARGETESPSCPWCFRAIGPDDDEIETHDGENFHARCRWQHDDEEELREFLRHLAEDAAEKVREYRSLHPNRTLEHHARALLARRDAVVSAAVR